MSLSNKLSHELITAEEASNHSEEIGHIQLTDKGLFFTNCIDGDLSRWHLVENGSREAKTSYPSCFNVRTKVHEYGGKPYIVVRNHVYFVNYADQAVYCQPIENVEFGADQKSEARSITTPNSGFRYADFIYDSKRERLICVREDHGGQDSLEFAASKVSNCSYLCLSEKR